MLLIFSLLLHNVISSALGFSLIEIYAAGQFPSIRKFVFNFLGKLIEKAEAKIKFPVCINIYWSLHNHSSIFRRP